MTEAMACGTPVLAFRCGSVPEIVDEGMSGMIVETMEEAIAAVPRLLTMDRQTVRKQFELRFSSAGWRMTTFAFIGGCCAASGQAKLKPKSRNPRGPISVKSKQ
jgi:glycosyltransferase involved in cell wall biosynthesis